MPQTPRLDSRSNLRPDKERVVFPVQSEERRSLGKVGSQAKRVVLARAHATVGAVGGDVVRGLDVGIFGLRILVFSRYRP